MRANIIPTSFILALVAGCCVAPVDQGLVPATAIEPQVPADGGAAPLAQTPTPSDQTGTPGSPEPTSVAAVPASAPEAASQPGPGASPDGDGAVIAAATAPAASESPPPAGTRYAYEDLGLSVLVPDGWTQELMAGGIIALFSEDYPFSGPRDRGALMLISKQVGALPTDKAELEALLKGGLDPAAVKQAGPIVLPVGGNQAVQLIARGSDGEGGEYDAMHTIIQSPNGNLSVKAMAFDALSERKSDVDRVMESIQFTQG